MKRLSDLLARVKTRLSPNRSSRRGARVQGIVIHTTEGSYGSAVGWFMNRASETSSHYVVSDVARPGEVWTDVTLMVPESEKAWTARSANPVTINYELAGYARRTRADWLGPSRLQLETVAALVADDLRERPWIPLRHGWPGILGHGDLDAAGFPNNHTDPGPNFPWDVFLDLVRDFMDGTQGVPDVKTQPTATYPCLPAGMVRIPKAAFELAAWHVSGREGPRPKSAPKNVASEWPWYWEWLRCRYFGDHPAP